MSFCAEDSMPEALWGYMVENNEKTNIATGWAMHQPDQWHWVHRHSRAWLPSFALPGAAAVLPSPLLMEHLLHWLFAGLWHPKTAFPKGLHASNWVEKGTPTPGQWFALNESEAINYETLLLYVAMGISGKKAVNIVENDPMVMSWEESTITISVTSMDTLSGGER